MSHTIEISLTSPFTLRDLSQFVSGAEANGFLLDEQVGIGSIPTGMVDDRFIVDGDPYPITKTRLIVSTQTDG